MARVGHTPGPWTPHILDADKNFIGSYVQTCIDASPGDNFYFVIGTHPDGHLADVCHVGNGPSSMKNALLIAAAPDLLEALIAVVSVADRETNEFILARKAIAKATGETP